VASISALDQIVLTVFLERGKVYCCID